MVFASALTGGAVLRASGRIFLGLGAAHEPPVAGRGGGLVDHRLPEERPERRQRREREAAQRLIVGLVSIVVALTFHPALLMVLGDRIDRLRVPWIGKRVAASAGEEGPLWRRAILAVMRRPAISLVAG